MYKCFFFYLWMYRKKRNQVKDTLKLPYRAGYFLSCILSVCILILLYLSDFLSKR